jgi:DNA-binding NarL/FixJ family response regulator
MRPMKLELARRVRHEIAGLRTAGLDSASLTLEIERQLRTVVSFDRACWHNVDPATSIVTNVLGDSALDDPLLGVIEYADDDVNRYVRLATASRPAETLRYATWDVPARSRRYREVLQPMGLDDELTASFVDNSTFWACARLYRVRGRPAFDRGEVAFLAALSPLLAENFRRALLAESGKAARESAVAPGVVIIDERDSVDAMTPAAEQWLDDLLDSPHARSGALPAAVQALAVSTRAVADATDRTQLRSRVLSQSGRWLVLQASPLTNGRAGRVAVVIAPAPSVETAPLIIAAYGLTERECQVLQHVVRGLSNKEISAALGVSRYTVGDHLKATFEKVGVASRGELVARIFFDQYSPSLSRGAAH